MNLKLTSVYVDDQEKARRFYTDVLGLTTKADVRQGRYRWLTVASPDEPDGTELHLALNDNPAAKAYQQAMVQQGQPAVIVHTDDLQREYDRLAGMGVTFTVPLTQAAGGSMAVLHDTCGNLVQLTQPARSRRDRISTPPRRDGDTMATATRTDPQSPALHAADRHTMIRVHGARENNLKHVSVDIPKRRLTVFTGVSGSGKSSLVFDTIAAESQRLINETYSAFVQGFMPTLPRPDVDVLNGLTTAIVIDQERMGANTRSTVGTATDANAMLRILFSRLGEPQIGPPIAFSFNVPTRRASGSWCATPSTTAGCARAARAWGTCPTSTCPSSTTTPSRLPRARSPSPAGRRTAGGRWGSTPRRVFSTRTSRSATTPKRSFTTSSTKSRPR